MNKLCTLCFAFIAASSFAQNSSQPPPEGVTELSPPLRAGRRGGVYVTGSTNPFSLGVSNGASATATTAAGGYGSGVRTNYGSGTSQSTSGTNSIVATNSAGIATSAAPEVAPAPGEVVYPVIPVVPGRIGVGNQNALGNGNGAIIPENGSGTGATPQIPNPGVATPPPPLIAPGGTGVAPQGTATAPQGTATAPQGTPSAPPPLPPTGGGIRR